MIKNNESIIIHQFMADELKLKSTELMIYAVIYSEQQDNRCYDKPLSYLMEWTNCTKQGVIKALKSLQSKNLIKREDVIYNGVKKIEYWCI